MDQPDLLEGDRLASFQKLWNEATEQEREQIRVYISGAHSKDTLDNFAERIILRLNELADKQFRLNSKEARKGIVARLRDGATVKDCLLVVAYMTRRWKGTKFEEHLNPITLFRPANFEKYLGQARAAHANALEAKKEISRHRKQGNPSVHVSTGMPGWVHKMIKTKSSTATELLTTNDLSDEQREFFDKRLAILIANGIPEQVAKHQALMATSYEFKNGEENTK